ncbi:serpin family protein [Bacillus horti]|uniref:Serpin B n=2 Tax=Caldalkalibacillus horti TaxID=77523 RepID=A0ABT9W0W1_9BACI|nr:serpin family protein [Bacillus horti]MDQ0166729.1 serpin B [Bacillus horti]
MRYTKRFIVIMTVLSLVILTACGHQEYAADEDLEQSFTTGLLDSIRSFFGMEEEPMYEVEDVNLEFTQAQSVFSHRLYQTIMDLNEEEQNVIISPLSIALALALTYNGADGETKSEMELALHLQGYSIDEINEAFKVLKNVLAHADEQVEININESLWTAEGIELQEDFVGRMTEYYGADITELDFTINESVERINKWVREGTNNKIEQIVDRLDPQTTLVLLNTVYFLGSWTIPFEEGMTQNKTFHLSDGTTKQHPMMARSGSFAYYENDQLQAVKISYGEQLFNMHILLPQEGHSVNEVSQRLFSSSENTTEEWNVILEGYTPQQVNLSIPRFELEYELQLNEALQSMGMSKAFGTEADFSKMLDSGGIWIDEVKHKTYIRTDEKGTEAAASTSVAMPTSLPLDQITMTVDRPFLFFIIEEQTDTILFMGSISNPEDVE